MDRAIEKLPGQGKDEFCHWDLPVADIVSGRFSNQASGGSKLSLTASGNRFAFVPGTNTREFCTWFAETYGKMYGGSGAKFAIDKSKDPCQLWLFMQHFELEAGAVAIWHPHSLHSAKANGNDQGILFGDYNCGFVTSETKQTRDMFIECLEKTSIPPVWKSGDPINPTGMPQRFKNYSSHITGRLTKLDKQDPWVWEHMLSEEVPQPDGTVTRQHRMHKFKKADLEPIKGFIAAPADERLRHPVLTPYLQRRLGLESPTYPYRAAAMEVEA